MRGLTIACAAVAVVFVVAGCASTGRGPHGPSAPSAPIPSGSAVHAALADLPMPSPATAVVAIGTVLEQGDGAILCLGAVDASAPPQCDGPELGGWDWDAFEHQEADDVRWVDNVALEGVYEAVGYSFWQILEPMRAAAITVPAIDFPTGELDEATIETVQTDVSALDRADILGTYGQNGIVVLDVIYDDGAMQAALDEVYGPGVVFVVSALRPGTPPPVIPSADAVSVVTGAEAQAALAALPTPVPTGSVVAGGTVLEASDTATSVARVGVPMLCWYVLESLPPQCAGPELLGWDWSSVEHEEASGVRWTEGLSLRANYDAEANTLTVLEVLDTPIDAAGDSAVATGPLSEATMAAVQEDIMAIERADVLSSGQAAGIILIDVMYDDGSLQSGFDAFYGPGVVRVTSWLR